MRSILEADRCAGIKPVSIKTEDQQALLALHRVRSQWMASRTARINTIRGLLAEFGVSAPAGPTRVLNELHQLLAHKRTELPSVCGELCRRFGKQCVSWSSASRRSRLSSRGVALEQPVIHTLRTIPGIGVLTATALFAAVGNVHAFRNGRQLACWLGLTPREHSTGGQRRLGRISKQGDPYLRMLLVHGARSALNAARRRDSAGQPLTQLQAWSLQQARAAHSNKATVAIANKLARIVWALWYHDRTFDGNHVQRVAA